VEDQAAGLRRLFSRAREPVNIAFAGSRGASGRPTGTSFGRSAIVAGLARGLAALGKEVLVVDENPGPDSVAAAFGLASRFDLLQAVNCDVPLAQVLLQAEHAVRIVPAARAARESGRLDGMQRHAVAEWLRRLQKGADFVLTDTSGHAAGGLSPLVPAPRRLVVVAAANSLSITEAYAQVKRLAQEGGCRSFGVIVARTAGLREGETVFANMRDVARRHLGVELDLLGCLPAQGALAPACHALAEALLRSRRPAGEESLGSRIMQFGRGLGAPDPVV
jgi:flagellar biosynthesis protein FlhG